MDSDENCENVYSEKEDEVEDGEEVESNVDENEGDENEGDENEEEDDEEVESNVDENEGDENEGDDNEDVDEGDENEEVESNVDENEGDVDEGDDNEDEGEGDDNEVEDEGDDNEDEGEDGEEEEEMGMDYFKDSIKQYLELDEEIKILNKACKIRKDKKNKISECILSFIQEKDISHINLQGNYQGKQIQSKEVVKKTSVSFKSITDIIFEFFEDKQQARTLLEQINVKRETSTSNKLQIAKPQKSKNNSQSLNKLITNSNTDNSSLEQQIPENLKYLYTTTTN